MSDVGKILILIGVAITLIGGFVWGLGRIGFRGLPGDIRYESDNVRFYFPVATCLVVSLVLTAVIWLWQWLSRK